MSQLLSEAAKWVMGWPCPFSLRDNLKFYTRSVLLHDSKSLQVLSALLGNTMSHFGRLDGRAPEVQWVRWPWSLSSSRDSGGGWQRGRFLGWGKTPGRLKHKGTRGQLFSSTRPDSKLDNHLDNKTQLPLIGFIFVTGENHAELKHAHCICRNWQAIS